MPRIPQYDQGAPGRILPSGTIPGGASASDFAAPAAAFDQFSRAFDVVGAAALDAEDRRTRQNLEDKRQRDAIMERAANEDAAVRAAQVRSSAQINLTQALAEMQDAAAPGASGFVDKARDTFERYRERALNAIDSPKARRLAEVDFAQLAPTFLGQALDFEAKARGALRTQAVADLALSSANVIAANPDAYEAERARVRELIEGMGVPPTALPAVLADVDSTLAQAAAEGVKRISPEALQAAIGGQLDGNSLPANFASYRAAVIATESGGQVDAANPNSSARGRFQFIARTWNGLAAQYPDLALTPEQRTGTDPASLAAQDRAFDRFTIDNAKALQAAGFAPTQRNLYSAHLLGAGGATRMLSALAATPDAPATAHADPDAVASNRAAFYVDGRPRTVAEFYAFTTRKIPAEASFVLDPSGIPDRTGFSFLDRLTPQQRTALYNAANEQLNRNRALARAELEPRLRDASAALLATGAYAGAMPGPDDFLAAYGPTAGPAEWRAFEATRQVGAQVAQVRTLTPDAQAALLAQAKPTDTAAPGFAERQKAYETLAQAVAANRQARAADPVAYVASVFPDVREAWAAVQGAAPDAQPQATAQAISRTWAAQAQIGIPEALRGALTKDRAELAAKAFNEGPGTPDERAKALAATVFSTSDRAQQQAVFRQLVGTGVPAVTEGALEALARGDAGAAQRLFRAATLNPADVPDSATYTDADIKARILSDVLTPGTLADAVYGLSLGAAGNDQRVARDTALMTAAIKLELAKGRDLDEATAQATRDLHGNLTLYDRNGALLAIPAGADEAALDTGLEALRDQVRDAMGGFVPAELSAGTDAERAGARIRRRDALRLIDDLAENGVWRNVNGGFGLLQPATGLLAAGTDGKPIVFTMEQVRRAAAQAAEAEAAAPADPAATSYSLPGGRTMDLGAPPMPLAP
ncbi:hypothetical protein [Zavarzinia sp. CC-PAN008]|uniref:hypothetical protein n=1 Tax=Zavarzinia sp. CC-PAN008 TaxID=3243332 RepID=UPI003F7453E3